MRKAFSAYPDLLMLDATYKLNDLRMPEYLLICVDANGESEIVGVWIVMNEEKSTIVRMSECFKKHNPNHNQIEVVVIDKDMTERDTLKEQFPRASIQLCLFHTLRAFKREITTIKMGITDLQVSRCLEIISKMAYAESEDQYEQLYRELKNTKIKPVLTYFDMVFVENGWKG